MRKLFILFIAVIALSGCKKSDIQIFENKPEERLAMSVSEVRTALTGSSNGWIGTLSTSAGGGFSFYMTFDASDNVKMYSDITTAASTTSAVSTYRLKAVAGTELIFDTFNYPSLLVDPVPSVFGGAAGSGFKSDVEFIFKRAKADSLFFIGKKYLQPLVFVKATAAQKTSYENGEYKTAIDKLKAFLAANRFPYIEITSGAATIKVGIAMDVNTTLASGKRINFTGVLADGVSTATAAGKFGFQLYGADILNGGIVYQGISFIRIMWKDANTLALYDTAGKEYIIKNSSVPVTPLKLLMAYNNTYKGFGIGTSLPLGVTSAFNTVYQASVTKFAAMTPARTLVSIRFAFVNGTTATVTTQNNNGTSTFAAVATYNYTLNDGIITLSNPVYDGNWTARVTQLIDIQNYFLTGPFRLDWVSSTNPANTSLMGGMYRVNDPTSFFYGTF